MAYEKVETIAFADSIQEAVHLLEMQLNPDKRINLASPYDDITDIIIKRRSFNDGNPFKKYMVDVTFVVRDDET